jgi:hypothetical protein
MVVVVAQTLCSIDNINKLGWVQHGREAETAVSPSVFSSADEASRREVEKLFLPIPVVDRVTEKMTRRATGPGRT